MKRIIITGAGGLIANGIAAYLKNMDSQTEITGVSPRSGPIGNFDHVIDGSFGERLRLPENTFDLIVHCAFDKDDKSNERNTLGTREWVQDAEKAGIKKHIFMSSISSQSEFQSSYGKSKKELEAFFFERGYYVFRLGLVIADGGMFGRLLSSVRRSPVIPLIGGGKFLVFPTDPVTIYDLVYRIAGGESVERTGRAWNLQYSEGSSLRSILSGIRKHTGKKTVFLPVPYSLVFLLLKTVSLIRLPGIEIDTGNLKGLKWNSRLSLRSDLAALGYPERGLEKMLMDPGVTGNLTPPSN